MRKGVAVKISAETKAEVLRHLQRSWSAKTSLCFNPEIAPLSYGQCAPTAIVVFEEFGGEILRTEVSKVDGTVIRHFYNRIGGEIVDFTKDQFDTPKTGYWGSWKYLDIPSSVEEALTEMCPGQLQEMRRAFRRNSED
jgi:hypothetical protein